LKTHAFFSVKALKKWATGATLAANSPFGAFDMLLAEMPEIVQAWMLLEAVFFVYFTWRLWAMQRVVSLSSSTWTIPPKNTFLIAWERMRSSGMSPEDIKCKWLMPWFLGCTDPASIKEGNVFEFVSWSLFSRTVDSLTGLQAEDVRFVLGVMMDAGVVLEPGYTSDLRCMRVGYDPLQALHRPLLVYAIIAAMQQLTEGLLVVAGFRRSTAEGFTYWHWQAGSSDSKSDSSTGSGCTEAGSHFNGHLKGSGVVGGSGIVRGGGGAQQQGTMQTQHNGQHGQHGQHGQSGQQGQQGQHGQQGQQGQQGHLLFFHGIGAGLLIYLPLLARLLRGGRFDGCILVEIPALAQVSYKHTAALLLHTALLLLHTALPPTMPKSCTTSHHFKSALRLPLYFVTAPRPSSPLLQSMVEAVPQSCHLLRCIDSITRTHHLPSFGCVAGHSFGTVCVSWLLRSRPLLVRSALLIDPVCFLMQVLYVHKHCTYHCAHDQAVTI
jgi:hypothetical protein